jgi:hypothetical protein
MMFELVVPTRPDHGADPIAYMQIKMKFDALVKRRDDLLKDAETKSEASLKNKVQKYKLDLERYESELEEYLGG